MHRNLEEGKYGQNRKAHIIYNYISVQTKRLKKKKLIIFQIIGYRGFLRLIQIHLQNFF